jgi:hypothetical protein
MLLMEVAGRGVVVWQQGRITVQSPDDAAGLELEAAVVALLEDEGVDVREKTAVRDAVLTLAGARLLTDADLAAPSTPGVA